MAAEKLRSVVDPMISHTELKVRLLKAFFLSIVSSYSYCLLGRLIVISIVSSYKGVLKVSET